MASYKRWDVLPGRAKSFAACSNTIWRISGVRSFHQFQSTELHIFQPKMPTCITSVPSDHLSSSKQSKSPVRLDLAKKCSGSWDRSRPMFCQRCPGFYGQELHIETDWFSTCHIWDSVLWRFQPMPVSHIRFKSRNEGIQDGPTIKGVKKRCVKKKNSCF